MGSWVKFESVPAWNLVCFHGPGLPSGSLFSTRCPAGLVGSSKELSTSKRFDLPILRKMMIIRTDLQTEGASLKMPVRASPAEKREWSTDSRRVFREIRWPKGASCFSRGRNKRERS